MIAAPAVLARCASAYASRAPPWDRTSHARSDTEQTERNAWWEMVEAWSTLRWGGVMGGRSQSEEAVFDAMRREEVQRRVNWNVDVHGISKMIGQ